MILIKVQRNNIFLYALPLPAQQISINIKKNITARFIRLLLTITKQCVVSQLYYKPDYVEWNCARTYGLIMILWFESG